MIEMDKPSFDDLVKLLVLVKDKGHDINRVFFSATKNKKKAILSIVEYTWGSIHSFRSNFDLSDVALEKLYLPIQKIAGQLSRMRKIIQEEPFNPDSLKREYLVFRRFIEQYEKVLVKKKYTDEVGIWPEKVGSIKLAIKKSGKSESTIRRYIYSGKIKAYKITKNWWIPYEEIKKISAK